MKSEYKIYLFIIHWYYLKLTPAAGKLPFKSAPPADRNLPDMHLSLYNEVVVFDQATKIAYTCVWLHLDDYKSPQEAFMAGKSRLRAMNEKLNRVPSLDNAKVAPRLNLPSCFCCNRVVVTVFVPPSHCLLTSCLVLNIQDLYMLPIRNSSTVSVTCSPSTYTRTL